MCNFARDIKKETRGEPIEGIVIGAFGWGEIESIGDSELGFLEENIPFIPFEKRGVVLLPKEALALLNYDYDTEYGSPGCHAVYVWTATRVIWVTQYDGSTTLDSAPRNPVDIIPEIPGG